MDVNKANTNYQDGPHHEGQQNNTTAASGNNTRSHREMNNDSEAQQTGRSQKQKESRQASYRDAGGQLGKSSASGTNK